MAELRFSSLYLPAIDAACESVDTASFAFGDIFQRLPHLVFQADGCSASGDTNIVHARGQYSPHTKIHDAWQTRGLPENDRYLKQPRKAKSGSIF